MTDQAVEDIVRPLMRHLRADSGALVVVNHGEVFPDEISQEIHQALRSEGVKFFSASFRELAPDPIARLLELRRLRGIDVFSIRVPAEGLGHSGRNLVRALNLHRSIFAREKLHTIFWIPHHILPMFVEHASNFLDFRSRLVDLNTKEDDSTADRNALEDLPLESFPRTLKAFLSLAHTSTRPDSPSERAKYYSQIPECLEDPEEIVYLLDRLRRITRNGVELFYLDRAARMVQKNWPDFFQEVQAFRDRMFDHIPPPPEGLFDSIETSLHGEVPLWCQIPAGQFEMGSRGEDRMGEQDEWPRHTVTVASSFRLLSVPVTNALYRAFDPASADGVADHPVVGLKLSEICSFCCWLARWPQTKGARLPTEEEWEYACRAGATTRYWSGDKERDLAHVGWYDANSGGTLHAVGRKAANPWGLYDVHGNVWEWTASLYESNAYEGRRGGLRIDSSQINLSMDSEILGKVSRGGSFASRASAVRAAYRGGSFKHKPWGLWSQGFRVLLSSDPEVEA